LGSWANTIFVNDFDGLVIKNNILWKEIISKNNDTIEIRVWAGENRCDFVVRCTENNFVGIENLAYIPSSVWATAVQNIWAYGVEAKDIIKTVEWINLETKKAEILSNQKCNFGYRESVFKNELKDKFIITHVVFELKKFDDNYKFNCYYRWIAEKITKLWLDESKINPIEFVNLITEIRKAKLPDREKTGTAGSFFKNPVISNRERKKLKNKFTELQWFDVEDWIKLSAGQLIDMCGFKWQNNGKVGTYKNHALILVNEWTATGQDIKDFANQIQAKVKEMFWIELWPEAIFVE
jgi:UDP-N-acetylmuramate dehydrogenase